MWCTQNITNTPSKRVMILFPASCMKNTNPPSQSRVSSDGETFQSDLCSSTFIGIIHSFLSDVTPTHSEHLGQSKNNTKCLKVTKRSHEKSNSNSQLMRNIRDANTLLKVAPTPAVIVALTCFQASQKEKYFTFTHFKAD